jgi:hypothetical protein
VVLINYNLNSFPFSEYITSEEMIDLMSSSSEMTVFSLASLIDFKFIFKGPLTTEADDGVNGLGMNSWVFTLLSKVLAEFSFF